MDASWYPTWFTGKLGVEIPQQLWVEDEGVRDPGVLLGTVPLPIDEVLETSNLPADIQDAGNHVGRVALDEARGRGLWCWWL